MLKFASSLLLSALLPSASAASFAGQVIYQVMPDRFFNGNKANDGVTDPTNLRAWHGGDLAGLTSKLNYLQKLGVSAVWLTPIYQQQPGRSFDTDGYHGYWPADFRKVDSHFGTQTEWEGFVKAAHTGGLKVILDQVINHFGYTSPTVTQKPEWFHTQADCDAASNKDVVCPLAGLPDLKQETPAVRDFLFGNDDYWRTQGVDGFRYDAIKNVPNDFLKALLARDRAAGTWTLGEYYGADALTVGQYQQLGFDGLFDFQLQDAMKTSIMGGGGLERVRSALTELAKVPQPGEVALFLDNHDLPRFAQGTLFEDLGQDRTKYGLRALLTLRGVPVIWQGTEIAMRGGGDPDNRRDMRFESQWTPAEQGVFAVASNAVKVRRASKALSLGDQTLLDVPDNLADRLLLFVRREPVSGQQVLVAWHSGEARTSYSLKSTLPAQALTRGLFLDPGESVSNAKLSISHGYLNLSLPPKTAMVFVLGSAAAR
ncbi:alpha-amylase family glycosyl hydrolase [Deinococcus rubellus]|uniref:Alpha-amylase n=1 Tax=Deinococcus rubellus TaxID=1889240 RepID=A0ABY5YDA5_9DEIO|nr:alpha-amylase family glycosyl hydrolase [Deinococcus rubellus]UWX63059.1 alpha-amylase family glycosyl hydrolase [Deinococcus rubellus]